MSGKLLGVSGAAFLLMVGGAVINTAMADTSITITATQTACQVSAPVAVAAPATPSAAAGTGAEKNKNYALALANLKPLAQSGNPEAERLYGALLMQKCTGIQDEAAGATWLAKAADGGDAIAQTQLGQAYMNGEGVAEDDSKAFALLTQAATAGQAPAEMSLGYLYLSGRGVPVDLYQGMVWTVKAGEQGVPAALSNIAHGYFKGDALPQNNALAAYYIQTAMQRASLAQRLRFQDTINNIQRALSSNDFKRAADKARRWSPGAGSLSDVLDDAGRVHQRQAKN